MEYISHCEEETKHYAKELSKGISVGDNITLKGQIGSGKTCFTRSLIEALGHQGLITSPTFTLINEYALELRGSKIILFHSDLYRLNDVDELFELGLEAEIDHPKNIVLVEWLDKFPMIQKKFNKQIQIDILNETSRKFTFCGF